MKRTKSAGSGDAVTFTLNRRARKEDSDRLERGLIAYNNARVPSRTRFQQFTILARSPQGRLLGGVDGSMYWEWLFISKLWIDARTRHRGLGSKLLGQAEVHARDYGCHSVWLDTMSFQARPFYEKHGYRCFGELADYPTGHARYFMTKRLAADKAELPDTPAPRKTASRPRRKR